MTDQPTSIRLSEEDKAKIAKAKKHIPVPRKVKLTAADVLREALYFFVDAKEAEKSVDKPTPK